MIRVSSAGRDGQILIRAEDDLVDGDAVLALLHANRVLAGGREIHVRALRTPPVLGPTPRMGCRRTGAGLQNRFERICRPDARDGRA